MQRLGNVSPVLQLVITGVKSKGLHDVTSGPEKLAVQLSHCNANDIQIGKCKNDVQYIGLNI